MSKILSLDLSTKSTGYAIKDQQNNITYGTLKASSSDVITRIVSIVEQISNILNENKDITTIIAEEVPAKDEFNNDHTKKVLMWLQGAMALEVHRFNSKIKIEFMESSAWRKWIGIKTGRGIKREELKQKDIEYAEAAVNAKLANDDEADAICLLLAYQKSTSLSI